jgi:hypothetical protein
VFKKKRKLCTVLYDEREWCLIVNKMRRYVKFFVLQKISCRLVGLVRKFEWRCASSDELYIITHPWSRHILDTFFDMKRIPIDLMVVMALKGNYVA